MISAVQTGERDSATHSGSVDDVYPVCSFSGKNKKSLE